MISEKFGEAACLQAMAFTPWRLTRQSHPDRKNYGTLNVAGREITMELS
jgi:hypothetical protein